MRFPTTTLACLLLATCASGAESPITELPGGTALPGTSLLTDIDDLSLAMQQAAHRYIERKITEAPVQRQPLWDRDTSTPEAYAHSVQPNRERFIETIGAVDARVPVSMERFGTDTQPALVAQTEHVKIWQVRWPVLDGVTGEGLLLVPSHSTPTAHVIALPDASELPETIAGLRGDSSEAWALALAEAGVQVLIPTLIDRDSQWSGNPFLATHHPAVTLQPEQTHREWIYRQAFHMGRHVIGYEVQKVMAAVDWVKQQNGSDARVGVAGYGEGGLVAFYSGACDPRIDATLVSGYFNTRQRVWEEPIYRNVFNLLGAFGDAEIASLIAPRALIIEHSKSPEVSGQKGRLTTPNGTEARREFDRIGGFLKSLSWSSQWVAGRDGKALDLPCIASLPAFAAVLGVTEPVPGTPLKPVDQRKSFEPGQRQKRAVRELEAFTQRLVRQSELVRDNRFLGAVMPDRLTNSRSGAWFRTSDVETESATAFAKAVEPFREELHTRIFGKFPDKLLPPNARTRAVYSHPKWTAYEVVLDISPESFAWGTLVLPNDLQPGEQRPVVVCQHGLESLPRNTIVPGHWVGVADFAGKLAERGFITFAPHNLYRHEDQFRFLDRKANTIGLTLYSLIIAHHRQILGWLETLPSVDPKRIAFYGISYGGTTAMFVPSILTNYCLSICTANLNDWTRLVAGTEEYGYMHLNNQWEMPYFDMGNTFSHAEMGYLIAPRPFMVERGHHDAVARDSHVASEYAKIRWLYAQLGIADRTGIEFFQGGHCIHGEGTFDFLHRHLNWPRR